MTLATEEFEILASKQIARLGKRRYPTPIYQLRVPPDVVEMQVRTHNDIDVLRRQAGSRQILEVRPVLHADRREAPFLVVSAARVDQNVATIDSNQKTVHAYTDRGRTRSFRQV